MDDTYDNLFVNVNLDKLQPGSNKNTGEDSSQPGPSGSSGTNTIRNVDKLHSVLVNPKQKGNPLLKYINNVPWEFDEIIPDYQMGKTACALFLSMRYHNLNPDYIHNRLKELGKNYELRVLLVQVDIKDPLQALKHLTRISILADLTLMLAWNAEDAGKIIETYKVCEKKPADDIMERGDNSPHERIVQALTTIQSINKTDAMVLLNRFGSLKEIIKASEFQLAQCPGFSSRKAKKLHDVLRQDFLKKN